MKLLIFLVLLCFSCISAAESFTGRVVRVLDGDTIDVIDSSLANVRSGSPVRVRLLNIDAPERKQPFGRWSTNQLNNLIAGSDVTVTYTQTDRYGRLLGHVFTHDGTEANRYMVESGGAWVYELFNTDQLLPSIEREAQKQKLGLWANSKPVPPWIWRLNN